ncbi:MAG: pantoate--beta-alanine ligase [Chloroflexi bacterium]|nr:pantoate--beta-alanine ligase [Chloroflexota bacterium]
MIIVKSVADLRRVRAELPGPLGLVPTMGFLHEGHLSLVRRARADCASVAVSIFVNPTQFGPGEDLERYPRALERDLNLLRPIGVDLVWTPPPEEVYPSGYQTFVTVEQVSRPLEGKARPIHFRGVATVVAKLLNLFEPHRAYFGQKDAQQTVVVRRMARDLDFPLEVVVCPTVREADGLAMSSRNAYLTPGERPVASVLYRALGAAKEALDRGEHDADILRSVMSRTLADEPVASEEYVSIAHPATLDELETVEGEALFSLAVRLGRTRLIDNFLLHEDEWSTGIIAEGSRA